MQLIDILSLEKWDTLEKKIHKRSGLNAGVFNSEGQRITEFVKWANRLCPTIKANKQGQSFICAAAHQNIAARAKTLHKPVIEECDAGLTKVVVPIFINDKFLGVASVCGFLAAGQEIDTFMINETIGIKEREIESKSISIPVMTREQIIPHIEFILKEVEQIENQFENSFSVP